jgi:hypothetical protein
MQAHGGQGEDFEKDRSLALVPGSFEWIGFFKIPAAEFDEDLVAGIFYVLWGGGSMVPGGLLEVGVPILRLGRSPVT